MKRLLALCAVLLALALPTSAWATCQYGWSLMHSTEWSYIPGPLVLEFDGAMKQVSANAPKGTILFSQTYPSSNINGRPPDAAVPGLKCTLPLMYSQRIVTTGPSLGILYGQYTYESGIPGVGLRVYYDSYYQFDGQQIGNQTMANSYQIQFAMNLTYTVELIKLTDAPMTGTGTISGTIAEWRVDQGGPIPALIFRMATPIVIQPRVPTCTISTPDVQLSLDQKSPSDFASVGSALGEQDFKVSLACSGGDANTSTNMHMFLTDQTTQTNQSNILTLTPASTASGVGVQILDGATPVTFGQTSDAPATDITRNIVVGTPTVDIPLKARYVRTGNMTAGSVTAIATFTTTYN